MGKSGFDLNIGGLTRGMSSIKDAIPSSGRANMEIAATHLEGEIKQRAPVDTGHLRGSYSHTVEKEGDKVVAHVGTNTPYAAYQEYMGTSHVRPAVEANRKNLVQIMAAETLSEAVSHAR